MRTSFSCTRRWLRAIIQRHEIGFATFVAQRVEYAIGSEIGEALTGLLELLTRLARTELALLHDMVDFDLRDRRHTVEIEYLRRTAQRAAVDDDAGIFLEQLAFVLIS